MRKPLYSKKPVSGPAAELVDFSRKMGLPEQKQRILQDGLSGRFTPMKKETSWLQMSQSSVKSIAKAANNDIINIAKGSIKYNKIRNQRIIDIGVAQENRVFATDKFGKFVKNVLPKDGYYDVALHGAPKFVSFYGEKIGANTLAEIIKGRSDYDGKMPYKDTGNMKMFYPKKVREE